MKSGTLNQINAQPEDLLVCVYCGPGNEEYFTVGKPYRVTNNLNVVDDCGDAWRPAYVRFRIVSRAHPAPKGPVRTVIRKEIQTGAFGTVQVQDVSDRIGIVIDDYFDATKLRAAIATLTEIADALEDQ